MYWVIFRRPASPSFLSASSDGTTTDINCMMMDAEMYGMIPRAKMEKRDSAPPENMLNRPRIPPSCWRNRSASASGLMPGTGMWVPRR
ncbi:Uncharacterised protein [Bordetella pertussis]|nr:Uncharacterised protein [Bordetella pertussis]CFP57116.1 Uncharacterised protein [Bordetella pertussis]CFU83339.1 Uncharacterised protein [Bordetella pertussis]CPN47179.1 Uncharacterised protein [Bordetella pertussis]